MKSLLNRLYSDYLLPNRIPEYERINKRAIDAGYKFYTIPEFYNESVLKKSTLDKCFIHRHDIDTDPKTARRFFEIEKKLGIRSSFYFRLNTIDVELMKELHNSGFEVGYHYEELAQYCKDFKIKNWNTVVTKLPEIQSKFAANFIKIEKSVGFKIKTIASHGDFVNRKLGHPNHELIDQNLMIKLGIDLECYNSEMLKKMDVMLSDKPYPQFYRDKSPDNALDEKTNVIYLLSHPRHWHVARWENTKDNFVRFWEGLKFGK